MALATTEKLLEQRQSDDVARVYEAYAKLKDAELNDTNKQDVTIHYTLNDCHLNTTFSFFSA